MLFIVLLESGPDYVVPEWRTYSKTGLFSPEVMLVMIFLQLVEKTALVLAGIDVVETIVREVIGDVPDSESDPEEGEQDRVIDPDDLDAKREQ